MGWFTKRGRLAAQQEQLAMARRALDALKVKTQRMPNGRIAHGWDASNVPLEYRDLVNDYVDTLVFYTCDDGAGRVAGTWDAVGELAEALAFVQVALTDSHSLTKVTEQRRQALRARTFANLLADVESRVQDHERAAGAGDDAWIAAVGEDLWRAAFPEDTLLADATEALNWFDSQEELDAATRARGAFNKTTYPRLTLDRMRADVEKLRSIARTGDSSNGQRGPPSG